MAPLGGSALVEEGARLLRLAALGVTTSGTVTEDGTVIAVTHDRWFARSFDRFVVFGADGRVYESAEPVFDETRVARAR